VRSVDLSLDRGRLEVEGCKVMGGCGPMHMEAGPEKYRERGNGVPRKAAPWQEGRGLSIEEL
jgi:hypothetical protein